MEYLLFVVYLVFFAWLATKTKFFLKTGLSKPQLIILFLLKVIIGIFYGWMGIFYGDYAKMLDTWALHHHGIVEYRLMLNNPHEYFTNLFNNPYPGGLENFFASTNSYWNDLKSNFFIKILSIFDIFSFGHYYVNVIFFSFITLFGPIAIYRVMIDAFPGKKIAIFVAVFLVPSFFYWTSGISKEGLIFAAIALIVYSTYFITREKKYRVSRIAGVMIGLLLLLLLRNFLIVITLPALFAWLLAIKWPRYGLICFAGVYIFFGILFFTLRYVDPRLDFPQAVVDKQRSFMNIVGNSSIPIRELEPNAISFLKNIPQAVTLSTFRPYPSDIRHLLSMAATLEVMLLLFLFIVSIVCKKKGTARFNPIVYFYLFFSFSLLLVVGFSVNNLGAIVRYRSVILPLLVVLISIRMDWERVGDFIYRQIIKINNIKNPSKIPY